jgi:hypothetical protein
MPGSDTGEQSVGNSGERYSSRSGGLAINHRQIASHGPFHGRIVWNLSKQREMTTDIFGKKFLERCDVHEGASG